MDKAKNSKMFCEAPQAKFLKMNIAGQLKGIENESKTTARNQ